jgi:hypothetical protein
LNYLRGVQDWTKARMTDAPTEFSPAWKRHALDDAGTKDQILIPSD